MRSALWILILPALLAATPSVSEHRIDRSVQQCLDENPKLRDGIACAREGERQWRDVLKEIDLQLRTMLPTDLHPLLADYVQAWSDHRQTVAILNQTVGNRAQEFSDGAMWTMFMHAMNELQDVRFEVEARQNLTRGELPAATTDEPGPSEPLEPFYVALKQALGPDHVQAVDAANAAWETYRDKRILLWGEILTKSGDPAWKSSMQANLHRDWAAYLRSLIADLADAGLGEAMPLPWSSRLNSRLSGRLEAGATQPTPSSICL